MGNSVLEHVGGGHHGVGLIPAWSSCSPAGRGAGARPRPETGLGLGGEHLQVFHVHVDTVLDDLHTSLCHAI